MPDPNILVLKKETFLKLIDNSIGSTMFNSLYALFKDKGGVEDIFK